MSQSERQMSSELIGNFHRLVYRCQPIVFFFLFHTDTARGPGDQSSEYLFFKFAGSRKYLSSSYSGPSAILSLFICNKTILPYCDNSYTLWISCNLPIYHSDDIWAPQLSLFICVKTHQITRAICSSTPTTFTLPSIISLLSVIMRLTLTFFSGKVRLYYPAHSLLGLSSVLW